MIRNVEFDLLGLRASPIPCWGKSDTRSRILSELQEGGGLVCGQVLSALMTETSTRQP